MNREDIIRMAHESHLDVYGLGKDYAKFADALERFAALVASAEREYLRESFRVVTAAEASAAILHEREACAKVCEEASRLFYDSGHIGVCLTNAGAIRARGQA